MPKLYTLAELRADWGPIQAVFLDAMNAGYTSEGPKITTIKSLPHSNVIEYRRGKWRVVDIFFVGPHSAKGYQHSGGQTLIYYNGMLVWSMQYWGWYSKPAIQVLKKVLGETYKKRVFHGGRGVPYYAIGDGWYYNNVDRYRSGFDRFRGLEGISIKHLEDGGRHHYLGGLMI